MKIKLPVALRTALLTAMAGTVCSAYAVPFDPSVTTDPMPSIVNGLLVGDQNEKKLEISPNRLTVSGDIVAGAGDRGDIVGGSGSIIIRNSTVDVFGNIYAGASGVVSFPGYVANMNGGDGSILFDNTDLSVSGALRLGWLNDKKGTMGIKGKTTTVGGQIVLGFYNYQGADSLGSEGKLTISGQAVVTAEREVFVASGNLNIHASGSNLIGKSKLEIVGRQNSTVSLGDFASAQFESVLVGSYGESAQLELFKGSSIGITKNFQLSAGTVMIEASVMNVTEDAWFGDRISDASPIDSVVTLTGQNATFTSRTLSVWKDAEVKVDAHARLATQTLQTNGSIAITSAAELHADSAELLDGSRISISGKGLFQSESTQVSGDVTFTMEQDATITNAFLRLGDVNIDGTLHMVGTGEADIKNLTILSGALDSGIGTLTIVTASVDRGATFSVATGSEVSISSELELHGIAVNKGKLNANELILDGTSELTVAEGGVLHAVSTSVSNVVSLDQTGINGGTLGDITFADNAALELKNANTTKSIKTGKNNAITVSGDGNSLGEVTIGSDSSLTMNGQNTATSLTNQGRVDINGALTLNGSVSTSGQTTISGSLTAKNSPWNTGNAPVTLLINNNTKSDTKSNTMLTAQSGLTGDSFRVQVDMSQGIAGISGKNVTFADNDSTHVTFTKTDGNFAILGEGWEQKSIDNAGKVILERVIGSSITTYGYIVNEYSSTSETDSWKGTGITFDENYNNTYKVVDEKEDSYLSKNTVQKTSDVTEHESIQYGKVDMDVSDPSSSDTKSIVSKGVNEKISVSSQNIILTEGSTTTTIATGAKTWEVTDNTTIEGKGTNTSQIGGIDSAISFTENSTTYQGENLAALNIAENKHLTISNATAEIGQTLSMGDGAALTASNSKITIGGTDVKLTGEDVTYEVARLDADGNPIKDANGNYVMDHVRVSDQLRQQELSGVSLNLQDTTMEFKSFDVKDSEGNSITDENNDRIVFQEATVNITKTNDTNSKMELGNDDTQLIFNNSSIAGTGTLTNVVMNGGSLKVGNSPGVLTMKAGSYNGTHVSFLIDPEQTTPGDSHTIGPDDNWKNAPVSQLKLEGTTTLSNIVVSIYMETYNKETNRYESITDPAFYAEKFAEGTGFTLITGLDNLAHGSSFTIDALPTLQEGLVWDTSKLFTEGTIEVVQGTYSDPARIANTLVSAAETVSGFGQMARTHIYDVRLNGANVWVNGLGAFLNHSSHNGRTGFEYNAGGYAVGADTIVDNKAIVGVAFGQSFGKQTPKAGSRFYDAGKIDMDSFMFGLYGGTSFNMKSPSDSMKLDAYASYGRFDNDSTHRSFMSGDAATASWKENAYALGATLTRVHEVRENLYFSPFASLDYVYADLDSVDESSSHGNIHYDSTAYQNLSLSLGTGLTRVFHLDGGQELSPFVSVAYVGDLVRKNAKVTSRNATGAFSEHSVSPGRNAFQVNVGSGWKVTQQWGVRVGYTAEFRSGATDQGVNVGVNYAF